MAIAPLPDRELLDALTATRPPLRLLSFPGEGSRAADPVALPSRPRVGWSLARRARLRRSSMAVVLVGLLVGLGLPASALAGSAPSGPHPLVAGATYVVQPGDTLLSIAQRLGTGEERSLVVQMAGETGSQTVVPGEHIVLP